jgi:hypothetical protein
VFPTYQNVARARISFDHIFNTLRIVPVARGVHTKTEIRGERCDGVVGALAFAIFQNQVSYRWLVDGDEKDSTRLGRLGHYMADLVFRACTEDRAQALRALLTCCVEAVAAVGLLAVADEVDGGFRGGDS